MSYNNNNKRENILERLDNVQNEYFDVVRDILFHNTEKMDEDRNFIYLLERQKKLQREIIGLTLIDRELALETAKEALEEAFTPRIQELLSKKTQKEIGDTDE